MKIITDFCMYKDWKDDSRDRQAEMLLETIRAFAKMSNNSAFWTDAGDKFETNCIVVKGFLSDLETAECIPFSEIERVVHAWCIELANWCRDDADEDKEYDEYARKQLNIEIDEHFACGGLAVVAFDKDGKRDHELHILPIEKTKIEGGGMEALRPSNGSEVK